MPISRRVPLKELGAAMASYIARSKKRVMIQYVLLAGVNDGAEHARELMSFLATVAPSSRLCVNLIPYNPQWPVLRHQRTRRARNSRPYFSRQEFSPRLEWRKARRRWQPADNSGTCACDGTSRSVRRKRATSRTPRKKTHQRTRQLSMRHTLCSTHSPTPTSSAKVRWQYRGKRRRG